MKKLISMVSVFLMAFIMVACDGQITLPNSVGTTDVITTDTTPITYAQEEPATESAGQENDSNEEVQTENSTDQLTLLSTVITVDINPSIQIELDENDEIISVTAINEDGQNVLDQIDITGLTLDEIVDAIIAEALAQEYLVEGEENFIMFGIESDGEADLELEDALAETATKSMESRGQQTQVLVQSFNEILTDQDTKVSAAKAKLLEELLLAGDYTLDDVSELATLSIKDLKEKIEVQYGVEITEVVKSGKDNEQVTSIFLSQALALDTTLTADELANYSQDELKTLVKDLRHLQSDDIKVEAKLAYQLEELTEEQAALQAQIQLQVELNEEEKLALETELSTLETTLSNLEAEKALLETDIQTKLETLTSDLTLQTALNEALTGYGSDLAALEASLEVATEEEQAAIQAEIDLLNGQIESTSNELATVDAAIISTESELEGLNTTLNDKTTLLDTTASLIQDASSQIDSLDANSVQLQTELETQLQALNEDISKVEQIQAAANSNRNHDKVAKENSNKDKENSNDDPSEESADQTTVDTSDASGNTTDVTTEDKSTGNGSDKANENSNKKND